MSIEKWNPLKEMESIRRDMDRIWNEIFPRPGRSLMDAPWRRLSSKEGVAIPVLDLIDNGETIVVKVEMPGVEKENVEITMEDDTLHVKGTISKGEEHKSEDFYHSERSYKSFERSIAIPIKIEVKDITASLKEGILSITLPKAEEVKPKKIKVDLA